MSSQVAEGGLARLETQEHSAEQNLFMTGSALVAYIAAAKLAMHLAIASSSGFFIDELYFLACGEHLAWGYVDFPPLTAAQAWIARSLLGGSMFAIHLLPALAGAGLVLLTGRITREFGGGRFAQALAALATALAPVYLFFHSYLSMNSIEPLLWMGCALLVIRIIKTGNTKLWLWFGILAGIGIENKHTMALFCFAVVLGLLLTRERRLLWSRWLVAGAIAAFLIFLPNLIWMIQHHFPHLELLANIKKSGRDVVVSPIGFLKMQVLFLGPVALPVWVSGLWGLIATREGRRYRSIGLSYFVALAILLFLQAKVYYLAPIYPVMFAAGAVALERLMRLTHIRVVNGIGYAYLAVLAIAGTILAPMTLPILRPETFLRYSAAMGISQPRIENRATNALPQFFADRLGWPEMAHAAAGVYYSLPEEERARTAIFGNDYGQCGAIDYYGPALGLPKSIGNHLTYWYWGPRSYTGDTVIVLGDNRLGVEAHFEEVHEAAEVGHPYSMQQEHFTIYLCRKPRGWTFQSIWPELKNWR